ncbi:MAG TPA: PAS domain S-box protein [Burkholderiaceae bacterium]|nr:PAS domain S-box protein [Burkholderiaceae bacterium]
MSGQNDPPRDDDSAQTGLPDNSSPAIGPGTLEFVLDSVADLIALLDADGRYRFVNASWCRHFRVAREAAIGRSAWELELADGRQERVAAFRAALRTGSRQMLQMRIQLPGSNEPRDWFMSFVPSGPASREPSVAVIARDVTAEVIAASASQASEALGLVAARTGNIVVVTDDEGRIEWVNPAFTRITGYTADEAIGRRQDELLHHPAIDLKTQALRASRIASGQAGPMVLQRRSKDGRLYWVAADFQPVRDAQGRPRRYVWVELDITEHKRREAELLEARWAAEAANRAKSEFLSRMSHELRTPLNAVLGLAQLLLLEIPPLAEQQRTYVQEISNGGQQLLEMINQLLDFSRIDSGQMPLKLERVDLVPAMAEAARLTEGEAVRNGIRMELPPPDVPVWVYGDLLRLQQVLFHLLSNGISTTAAAERSSCRFCMG